MSRSVRKLAALSALLCLLGIAVSAELTRIHRLVHTDPDYHSVCAMSEGINCETVAASPYSVFAGLPVSAWGIAGYLAMGVLSLWAWSNRRLHSAWPWGLLLLLTGFSVCTSAVLGFISATKIDSLCLFCTASYAINALLFVLAIIAVRKSGKNLKSLFSRDLLTLALRPKLTAVLVFTAAAATALAETFVPAYWETVGWKELPELPAGVDASGRHWIGAKNPILTIVEFSDYECPHCRAAHKSIRSTAASHPDEIRLVHRHLPLDQACHRGVKRPFHTRACLFAEAAECAARQGKFWEMNDALFAAQETEKTQNVDPVDLAVRLGINRSEFKTCLERHETGERVKKDIEAAIEKKLTGTPSFLIEDRLFVGKIPAAELEKRLRRAAE